MGADPANIMNRVIIFLFIKNLYNCDTQKYIAGAKTVHTLADTFKLAHQSLLKLKKYEGLLYNEEHEVSQIQQHSDMYKNTNDNKTSISSNKNKFVKDQNSLTKS